MTKMLLDLSLVSSDISTSLSPVPAFVFVRDSEGCSSQRVSCLILKIYLLSSYSHILFICCRQEAIVFHVSYYHL